MIYKSKQNCKEILFKIVAKLCKYRKVFKDKLTFLSLDIRDATLPCCYRNHYFKYLMNRIIYYLKSCCE